MSEEAFALTGLVSRGGLSNWVFFFFPEELVMVDVGMGPSVKAGAQAGALSQLGSLGDGALANLAFGALGEGIMSGLSYGPQADATRRLQAWRTQLQAKAKNVVGMKDEQVRAIRFRMRLMAHELWLIGADGATKKFGLMNREHAESMMAPLRQRWGPRFEVSKTPAFAFFERYAPFLL